MGERIRMIYESLSMSQREFAQSLSVSPQYINDVVKQRTTSISNEVFYTIISRYGINPEWLLYGVGSMSTKSKMNNDSSINIDNSNGYWHSHNNNDNSNKSLSKKDAEILNEYRKADSSTKKVIRKLLNLSLIFLTIYKTIEYMVM